MTEILTESFCERCGTRYTFESAAPRKSRLGRVRVLGKGMRNFVLSDDASLSEAMADARSEDEIEATAHQLDAFHQTFNFCLTCRQYTCGDCWNTDEGRCLTCAPIPGMELPAAVVAAPLETADEPVAAEATNGHVEEAWPDADLSSARLARALGVDDAAEPGAEAAGAAAITADAVTDGAPAAADGKPPLVDAPDDAVAAQLIGIAPGQSLEDAIAEYEARLAADEAAELAVPIEAGADDDVAATGADAAGRDDADAHAAMAAAAIAGLARDDGADTQPAAEVEPEPEPAIAELEPEPIAAAPDPVVVEPEPIAAAPDPVVVEPEPVAPAEVEPEPVAAAAEVAPADVPRDDVVRQPVWPTPSSPAVPPVAPVPGEQAPPVNPWLTVAPEDPDATPQWPVAPAWPAAGARRDVPTTLAGRPLLPQADPSGLWEASAREVLTASAVPMPEAVSAPAPSAQPCVSCGLSLSANARFCRRCGTRQG